MVTATWLERLTKHQKYFYISIILIAGFFIGSAFITPKITLVAENLLKDIIQEDKATKKNIIAFEFNRLNSFLQYSERLINDSSEVSLERLYEKLLFTTDLAHFTNLISNSYIYAVTSQGIEEIHISEGTEGLIHPDLRALSEQLSVFQNELLIDTIIKTPHTVVQRKIYLKSLRNDTTMVVGYDIDLLNFWVYFSEKYIRSRGYTVITNEEGICILHPEPNYIGSKLEGFFESVSIDNVLGQDIAPLSPINHTTTNGLNERVTSEYLGIEVLRYFDKIPLGKTSLILIESFPVEINLRETTKDIQDYFSLISLMAFLTFILLLIVSRLQLKKEYIDNLKVLEEKERLLHANEKYQRENAVLQLNQLKKKMNPHFLFNNLNSLHVLIDSKPELSQEFVLKLAEVYRYLLENREGNLITVENEINFLKQYVFLQEIRFKDSLKVSIVNNSKTLVLYKKIPFLALETLVENAIKHNEITKDNPLTIEVAINENHIRVSNNYTPRKNKKQKSYNIGLDYLKNIYAHHQINSFRTEIAEGNFICFLPLLP